MKKSANINFRDINLQTDESLGLWEDIKEEHFTIYEPGDMRE